MAIGNPTATGYLNEDVRIRGSEDREDRQTRGFDARSHILTLQISNSPRSFATFLTRWRRRWFLPLFPCPSFPSFPLVLLVVEFPLVFLVVDVEPCFVAVGPSVLGGAL